MGTESEYWESLGFHADLQKNLNQIDHREVRSFDAAGYEHIVLYSDPSGANICLIETVDRFTDEVPTVRGTGGHTVEVFQVMPGTAHVDILDENGELQFRVLAFVDDPQVYPVARQVSTETGYQLEVPEVAKFQNYYLGAIAIDLDVYDNEEQWLEKAKPPSLTNDEVDAQTYMLGPSSVISPWLFPLYEGTAEVAQVNPAAMFNAICREVEVVTNHLTGKKWYRIQADCGFDLTLALPVAGTRNAPKPGSVVTGKAFLTGSTGFWWNDQPRSERV